MENNYPKKTDLNSGNTLKAKEGILLDQEGNVLQGEESSQHTTGADGFHSSNVFVKTISFQKGLSGILPALIMLPLVLILILIMLPIFLVMILLLGRKAHTKIFRFKKF